MFSRRLCKRETDGCARKVGDVDGEVDPQGQGLRVRTKAESRDGSLIPCWCQAGLDGFC